MQTINSQSFLQITPQFAGKQIVQIRPAVSSNSRAGRRVSTAAEVCDSRLTDTDSVSVQYKKLMHVAKKPAQDSKPGNTAFLDR